MARQPLTAERGAAERHGIPVDGQRFGSFGRFRGASIVKRVPLCAIVIVLVAMLGIAAPLTAAGPRAEGHKGQSQHKTFSNATPTIGIPDISPANPYPSTIKVSGFKHAKITDVDLELKDVWHWHTDDIDVLLVGPDGRNAIVMSDVGEGINLNTTITLDDEAALSLPDSKEFTKSSGTYQPANYGAGDAFPAPAPVPTSNVALAAFDGSNPNGAWHLFIVDDASGGYGEIEGWSLSITAEGRPGKHHAHHHHHKH